MKQITKRKIKVMGKIWKMMRMKTRRQTRKITKLQAIGKRILKALDMMDR